MMAASGKPARRIAPETGLEPHFHITDCTYEVTSDGTILIADYEEVHGELRLVCYRTVMPTNLSIMASAALKTSADAYNSSIFRDFTKSGDGGDDDSGRH
jgi:hypothetical protein